MKCKECNGTGIIKGEHIIAKCITCFGSGHDLIEITQPIKEVSLGRNMKNPYY